ncbi:MAG: hypothetical protein IJX51_04915 [Clostridia bacterium]|nr:hypothetical protein [Clostridia bacterium]
MNDTVKLLKECNAGVKMGVTSISRVMPHVRNSELKTSLNKCKDEHAELGDKTHKMLLAYKAETKEPHPVARMMSDMKIRGRLMMNNSEKTVADLMTDGCNMGVKSLSRYLNQYKNASEESKNIAKNIIASEQCLNDILRSHL